MHEYVETATAEKLVTSRGTGKGPTQELALHAAIKAANDALGLPTELSGFANIVSNTEAPLKSNTDEYLKYDVVDTGSTTRIDVTAKIVEQRLKKDLKWSEVANIIDPSLSLEWITSALLGQFQMNKEQASRAGKLFDLSPYEIKLLQQPPYKNAVDPLGTPRDPFIYRFYEIANIFSDPIKQIVNEKFSDLGDGIMSAVDFKFHIVRIPHPKGDRVEITYNGKYLPFPSF